MEQEKLNELCNKNGLRDYDLFVKWFIKRFPNEQHESYVLEWIGRFKGGSPTNYMDKQSLEIYMNLIGGVVI